MQWTIHNLLNVVSRILGILILYIAIFLYEDEEGRYQNWLEELWIKVRYGREAALSTAAAIFAFAAQATSRMFDRVFGPRLFSFRAAGVSVCFSIASFFFFVPLAAMLGFVPSTKIGGYGALWSVIWFMLLGLSPSVLNSKWERRLWGACLILILASNLWPIIFVIFTRMSIRSGLHFVTFLTFLLTLSLACDLCFLGFTRWMVRRISKMTSLPQMVGYLVAICVVAIGIVAAPFEFMLKINLTPDLNLPSIFGLASFSVIVLNLIDLLLCGVVFLVLMFFILHRLLWPIFERPLYATARYGLIKRKSLLWALGLMLLVGPGNAKSISLWLIEKLSQLKS